VVVVLLLLLLLLGSPSVRALAARCCRVPLLPARRGSAVRGLLLQMCSA